MNIIIEFNGIGVCLKVDGRELGSSL